MAVKIQKLTPPDALTLNEVQRLIIGINDRFESLKTAHNSLEGTVTAATATPNEVNLDTVPQPKIEIPTDTSSLANFQTDFENGFGPQVKNTLNMLIDEINKLRDILSRNNIAPS